MPILSCGTNNKELIRSLLEISNWVRFVLQDTSSTLAGSFGLLADAIRSNPTPSGSTRPEDYPNLKTWASDDHLIPIPLSVAAFS